MIHKGRSINEKFILRSKDGAISVSGNASAEFGYRMGSGESEADDGVWVDWAWGNDRFELKNDRLGLYPMFYHRDRNGFGVSNAIADLIGSGCSTELDDAAIAVFLRLGFYLGNDTPFKAIRALPPGAVLSWGSNGFRLESAALRSESSRASLPPRAAVEAYGELFQSAIEKFVTGENEKVALPLSGGRDSRQILFALLKANRRPDSCITVMPIPPRSEDDAAIASEVARFDKMNHVVLPQAADLLGMELEKNRLTNFCADEHAWILPLRIYLNKHSFTSVFDGIGGDVLVTDVELNRERLRLYAKSDLRELAEDILGPEGYLPNMIRPDSYAKWGRELAVEHLIPELEKYRGSPNPIGQFYFWTRTRREIAASPWGILNDPCHVFAPYLSKEVFAFLAALPASYLLDRDFRTEAIARYYPEHAHLPYETEGLPPTRIDRKRIAGYASDAARYCLFPGGSRKHANASFFLPRIAKGLLNVAYGTNLHALFNKAVYLTQLEELRDGLARKEQAPNT